MIKHIVMFKLKEANGKTARENALEAKSRAGSLPSEIPSLRKFEVQVNSEKAPDNNADIVLICDFDDIAGLDEYQVHPKHKEFGAFIVTALAENGRSCIDYEY